MPEFSNGTATSETLDQDTKKKKPKGKLKLLLVLFLAAALAAAAYYYFFMLSADAGEKQTPEPPVKTVDMGSLVVNLAGGSRYMRLAILVEIPDDSVVGHEFQEKEHRIRDSFLVTLRKKTAAEMSSPDGMDTVRAELLDVVNRHLVHGQARDVFFREYIVQ